MTRCILLAEDEATLLRLFSHVLEREGYTTLSASTSTEAEALLAERGDEIGALLLDVNLPPEGAEQVLKTVSAHCPELPVLIVSGKPLEGALAAQVELFETQHFLAKPFRPAELLTWVEALP
ncbi:MAG: response regulator [Myxococcota bacterium]|nr:response regulator [Myxococcota bacterium]